MKNLGKFKNETLSKSTQKKVMGGRDPIANHCPPGDYSVYLSGNLGQCLVLVHDKRCYGTLIGNNTCRI